MQQSEEDFHIHGSDTGDGLQEYAEGSHSIGSDTENERYEDMGGFYKEDVSMGSAGGASSKEPETLNDETDSLNEGLGDDGSDEGDGDDGSDDIFSL